MKIIRASVYIFGVAAFFLFAIHFFGMMNVDNEKIVNKIGGALHEFQIFVDALCVFISIKFLRHIKRFIIYPIIPAIFLISYRAVGVFLPLGEGFNWEVIEMAGTCSAIAGILFISLYKSGEEG